jgi:hypothetical protein
MPSTGDRRALIAQEHDPALKLPSQAHQRMLNGSVTGDTYRKNPARDQGQEPGTGRWKSLHLLTGARRSS